MNELVRVPLKLNPYLASFSDLFTMPSYVSFCHVTTTMAVCDKSKTVFNLHETMADDNKDKKGRSSYNWFITNGDWDEDEIAQRKADLPAKEILSIYEDRWDIETAHREANQKLGFKDYQLRSKKAIERFMQLVFAIWTGILLLMIYVMDCFNLPIPDVGGLLYKLKAIGLKVGT